MRMAEEKIQHFSERPHVLIIDDDRRIRELVSRFLHDHGFIAVTAEDASAARALMEGFEFDALVVDIMMPGESGLDFTRDIQQKHLQQQSAPPVLLLTALGEAEDRISGLESGADDYLTKPFEPKELVLRLNAILRRTKKRNVAQAPFSIGRWRFDPQHRILQDEDKNQTRQLTAMEVNLLTALAARPGEVMNREELAKACGIEAGERTIDVQVTRLRRKMEKDTRAPRYLQTVRGKGYVLQAVDI